MSLVNKLLRWLAIGINVYCVHTLLYSSNFEDDFFSWLPSPLYILGISLLSTLYTILIISDFSFNLVCSAFYFQKLFCFVDSLQFTDGLFKKLINYFCLCWVFAVHGLSLVGQMRSTLHCSAQSHCNGFSYCGTQALGVWAQQLHFTGSRAQA